MLQLKHWPWDQVAVFLKKYITCEGRYKMFYYSKFPLLSHLYHRALLNIPFYLFNDLHHMVGFVRIAKHPNSSLTHHGLIKLIILWALAQRNQTWEQFTGQIQINQEPALLPRVPIEEELEVPVLLGAVQNQEDHANVQLGEDEEKQEDRSPSNLVGVGR